MGNGGYSKKKTSGKRKSSSKGLPAPPKKRSGTTYRTTYLKNFDILQYFDQYDFDKKSDYLSYMALEHLTMNPVFQNEMHSSYKTHTGYDSSTKDFNDAFNAVKNGSYPVNDTFKKTVEEVLDILTLRDKYRAKEQKRG